MNQEHSENNGNFPQDSPEAPESFPKGSEPFGNASEEVSEVHQKFRKQSEKTEDHTITVREAAKILEDAGIAITERTIINWCNPNRRGVVRLDCYYDESDGKYFITPQSIDRAIKEELHRTGGDTYTQQRPSETRDQFSEPFRKVSEKPPKDSEVASESFRNTAPPIGEVSDREAEIRQLRQELMDTKILNKGKDFFIEQLQKDRGQLLEQVSLHARKIGQLETELRQLQTPRQRVSDGEETNANESSQENYG